MGWFFFLLSFIVKQKLMLNQINRARQLMYCNSTNTVFAARITVAKHRGGAEEFLSRAELLKMSVGENFL